MFKNNQEKYDEEENYQQEDVETIIGSSVKLEGDLIGEGNISIHGDVSGKIQTKGNLLIGDTANIKAEVSAANISVSGTVEGNIKSDQKLEISDQGKIIGDISSQTLSIAPGASFSGQSNMLGGDKNSAEKKSKNEKLKNKTGEEAQQQQ